MYTRQAIALFGIAALTAACGGIQISHDNNDAGAAAISDGGIIDRNDSGSGGTIAMPTQPARDSGVVANPDLALPVCSPACGANQVCSGGVCQNLPGSCPCPMGAYCDLGSNTCKAGCLADSDCSASEYCNTTTRQCAGGCRDDDGCANPADACIQHVCGNSCGTCDDNNVCTSDSCQRDQCIHDIANNGAACDTGNPCSINSCNNGVCYNTSTLNNVPCPDDGNACTDDVCTQGVCTHPSADGKACSDDNNVCTSDVCQASACAHLATNDNMACSAGYDDGETFCHAGACGVPIDFCICNKSGACELGGAVTVPYCSCSGTNFDFSYFGDQQKSCTTCETTGTNLFCWGQ